MRLTAADLQVRLGGRDILRGVHFTLTDGQWLMVAGPNGAGKSTLVGAISGALAYGGQVQLDGQEISRMPARSRALRMGVMDQTHAAGAAFTVAEVVAMGRYAHRQGLFHRGDPDGETAVEAALQQVALADLRHRPLRTLSGGEQQRALLAQVLCQQPDILILDEPANHLDLQYQQQLFQLLDVWRQTPGRAVISVVHDLSLARRFGDTALLLHRGKQVAFGSAAEVLSEEHLAQVWQMDVGAWMRSLYGVWQQGRA